MTTDQTTERRYCLTHNDLDEWEDEPSQCEIGRFASSQGHRDPCEFAALVRVERREAEQAVIAAANRHVANPRSMRTLRDLDRALAALAAADTTTGDTNGTD